MRNSSFLEYTCVCYGCWVACTSYYVNDCRNSVTIKLAFVHIHFFPHRIHLCVGSMVFIMQNPYLQAGEKQSGEKRYSTNDNNGSVLKQAKKAPSAASLVP